MIRILIFIALVLGLGWAFAWLADMPGEVTVTVGGQLITVSLMVAGVAVIGVIGAIMLLWWLIKVLFTSPERMQRYFRARRRDRGYQSLSTGIIAAGAGDAATARRMLTQSKGLLNETTEPLIQLLDAQATLLEGKSDEAHAKFEAMLEDPELRMLGMRGLYMEAQRLGDRDAQRHYAEKAADMAPHLVWAGKAAIDLKTASSDWDGALRLVEKQKAAKQITKEDAARKRAVLLTALAMDCIEADPARAKTAALEAHRLAPGFAPAAVTASQAALRLHELRRAVKVLETAWRKTPHPDIALAYVNARPGDSAVDRLKRAERLDALKPNTVEGSLIVGKMALEAGEFERARKAAASVLRNQPRESAYMLMADIEDAETGDQGRVREWLSRAVRAPRDPAWTADGHVAEGWEPFSPVTGRIDGYEWKVPVERLGPLIENDLDPMEPGRRTPAVPDPDVEEILQPERTPPAAPAAGMITAATAKSPMAEAVAAPEPEPTVPAEPEEVSAPAETADDDAVPNGQADEAEPAATDPEPEEVESQQPDHEPQAAAPDDEETATEPAANGHDETPVEDVQRVAGDGKAEEGADGEEEPVVAPIPDDPGIDPDAPDETDKPRRFRLF